MYLSLGNDFCILDKSYKLLYMMVFTNSSFIQKNQPHEKPLKILFHSSTWCIR